MTLVLPILQLVIGSESDVSYYKFKCTVQAGSVSASGYGGTKKEAKQNSALEALKIRGLEITNENNNVLPPQTPVKQDSVRLVNYVGLLNERASTNGQEYPNYTDNMIPKDGKLCVTCEFLTIQTHGFGVTKKAAKQEAAKNMLNIIRDQAHLFEVKVSEVKQDNINRATQEVIKEFAKIKLGNSNAAERKVSEPIPQVRVSKSTSLDELQAELAEEGYISNVKTFQKNPYIMMLTIETSSFTVMGCGDTKEEALKDLFEVTHQMFIYGSFTNIFDQMLPENELT